MSLRLRLSQAHLSALEQCPRKFQHVYLDQLVLPMSPDQRSRLEWGNQFHLAMQQRALGLPPAEDVIGQSPVQACVDQFMAAVPHLFLPSDNRVQESEHRRSLEVQGYLLTVVYDSLILERDRAEILDWKTYPKPQTARWLEASWQTRLYLYVLAETSHYAPAQLAMTYWFVPPQGTDGAPPHLTIAYSDARHQATGRELMRVLDHLTEWLADYQAGQSFPQVASDRPICSTCSFGVRCQRVQGVPPEGGGSTEANPHERWSEGHPLAIPSVADIAEVTL